MPRIPTFKPGPFQLSDGALVLFKDDGRAEPYFATKALLAARELGLNINTAATAWINWMLPLQEQAGNFQRYQLKSFPPPRWEKYKNISPTPDGKVDADDSLLSTWVELLYTLAPPTGLPQAWKDSADEAFRYLINTFRTSGPTAGLCQAFADAPGHSAAYLMDNCEVYLALRNIAAGQRRMGMDDEADETDDRTNTLAQAIISVMWKSGQQRFLFSEFPESSHSRQFYPHHLAQVYPILHELATPGLDNNSFFTNWLSNYQETWLKAEDEDHPSPELTANGQVAHVAFKLGRNDIAREWLDAYALESQRLAPKWTIWDEAIYQGLKANIP